MVGIQRRPLGVKILECKEASLTSLAASRPALELWRNFC